MNETYPEGSCVKILNGQGEILAVNRPGSTNLFGLPGGKVEPGETPIQCAVRELYEETGIAVQPDDLVYLLSDVCEPDAVSKKYFLVHAFALRGTFDGALSGGCEAERGIHPIFLQEERFMMKCAFPIYTKKVLEK